MKLFCKLVTLLTLAIISQSINITAINVRNRQSSEGCQLIISNDEEVLDLRTDCPLLQQREKGLPSWLQLIDLERAYLLQNVTSFLGYRYFKNKLHYKYLPQKLSIYQDILKAYLKQSQLQIVLPFEQSYSIVLNFNQETQKWSLTSLKIVYGFTHVQKIGIDEQKYTFQSSIITEKSLAVAKDVAIRRLSGKGLHQKISLKLELSSQTNIKVDSRLCKVIVEEILPESSYIDVDQLRSVQHYQVINVQKPQHFSKQYYYRYSFGLDRMKQVGVGKYSIEYPLHFRYPQPSTKNYTKVILHPSDSVVLSCLNDSISVLIPEDPFNDRGVALIFNGSIQDAKVVSMITFILMLLAVMVIARQLRKD